MARTRNLTRQERVEQLRARVRDCVADMGHGEVAAGSGRFIDHALWAAGQHGLRVWRGDRHTQRASAFQSLANLFAADPLFGVPVKPTAHTKGNVPWVLDIWQVACDDWFRVNPAKPKRPEPLVDPAEALALDAISPAMAEAMVNPQTRRLSARILDAYVNRDSDSMLEALAELETRGL